MVYSIGCIIENNFSDLSFFLGKNGRIFVNYFKFSDNDYYIKVLFYDKI